MNIDFLKAKHTTKKDEVMLISQMETDHLLNAIRFTLRKMVDLVSTTTQVEENQYKNALYGKNSLTPEQIADLINGAISGLAPYIVEAFFRVDEINKQANLQAVYHEIREQLEIVFARSGKLEGYKIQILLPPGMSIRRMGEMIDDLEPDYDPNAYGDGDD